MIKTLSITIILFNCFVQNILGQNVKDEGIRATQLSVNYAFEIPAEDIAKRFGVNSTLGFGTTYKLKKGWLVGGEGYFLFGSIIKDDSILSSLENSAGFIIDKNGVPADVILAEKGWGFNAYVGKLFPIIGPNPNSGLLINSKIGFMQHKVKVEVKNDLVPLIVKPNDKGYDLLSNGLALSQFIGYMHSDNARLVNFYFGIEIREAFTKNRRDFNFNTLQKDNNKYLDLFIGIKAGWFLPIYKKNHEETYYF